MTDLTSFQVFGNIGATDRVASIGMGATRAAAHCRVQRHRLVDVEAARDGPVPHLGVVKALGHGLEHLWRHHLLILILRSGIIRFIGPIAHTRLVRLVRDSALSVRVRHLALASSGVYRRAIHHLIKLLLHMPLVLVLVHEAARGRHLAHVLLLHFLVLLKLLKLLELQKLLILVCRNEGVLLSVWHVAWITLTWPFLLLQICLGLSKLLSLNVVMLLHHHCELHLLMLLVHVLELLL